MTRQTIREEDNELSATTMDLLLGMLHEALVTGDDGGVGRRLREAAVLVRHDAAAASIVTHVRHGSKYTPWEAFILGAVTGVVQKARHENPAMAHRVLRRWQEQQYDAAKKAGGEMTCAARAAEHREA
jgi:hypothetical protein